MYRQKCQGEKNLDWSRGKQFAEKRLMSFKTSVASLVRITECNAGANASAIGRQSNIAVLRRLLGLVATARGFLTEP